jgi:hypothetical protein
MNRKIENPATDEVCLVIQFLKTKDVRAVEIHRQNVEGKMNEGYVRKWYWLCKKGRQRATACRNARVGDYTRITRTVQVENVRASPLQSQPCAK